MVDGRSTHSCYGVFDRVTPEAIFGDGPSQWVGAWMGKTRNSSPTFEIVVGDRSVSMPVRAHKFVGTLCGEVLTRLKLGRDLSGWELREGHGDVVPFDCTEHRAGMTVGRHYYLIRVPKSKAHD